MQEISFEEAFEKIGSKDSRYQRDAYLFVKEALDYTQKRIQDEKGKARDTWPGIEKGVIERAKERVKLR